MGDRDKDAPAERVQRFRFRVVAPDGRELVSDMVQVHYPAPAEVQAQPAAALVMAEPFLAPVQAVIQPAPQAANFRVSAIFVSAQGKKQGALKGESPRQQNQHQFAALTLDYELRSPRDAATGQASGQRQHSPVTIVKEWGAATPQLFQALVTNEVLQTVVIDCYGVSKEGKEAVVHKVKLTNERVASIKQVAGGSDHPALRELETVAFSFEGIEHLSPADAVLASDGAGHAPAKARA